MKYLFNSLSKALLSLLALAAFSSSAFAANTAPVFTSRPSTTGKVGTVYTSQAKATDANGDTLVYTIANKPTWAGFSARSGILTGTPKTAGTYKNISIRVSDGHTLVFLPVFNITVATATTTTATTNKAPTISGTPGTTAKVGTAYSFKPTAADANGDTLGFSITNKPSWAAFNTSTGQLSGTPSSTGTASNIVIAVSDGKVSTSMSAFSIAVSAATTTTGSATLNWTKPTKNTDGSTLTDLAGYKIYYGTSSGALSKSVSVTDVNLTSYTLSNLTSGTWYFAISSVNSAGVEGPQTTASSKAI